MANFYPRPPRGGRLGIDVVKSWRDEFLSTPSARRATPAANSHELQFSDFYPRPPRGGRRFPAWHKTYSKSNFYPRPPRGGRPDFCQFITCIVTISIHALREEGDEDSKLACTELTVFLSTPSARRATLSRMAQNLQQVKFLSTPSARRATDQQAEIDSYLEISIHALREEGDVKVLWT